ncbi:hypothetical protein, partial [Gordonibacter sp. KGMB07426]|uniref:hypothetical protein n=1 Tax=Gordonibacter sp. KGMB07426 TaxID=3404046 RepID=UPI003B28474B
MTRFVLAITSRDMQSASKWQRLPFMYGFCASWNRDLFAIIKETPVRYFSCRVLKPSIRTQ